MLTLLDVEGGSAIDEDLSLCSSAVLELTYPSRACRYSVVVLFTVRPLWCQTQTLGIKAYQSTSTGSWEVNHWPERVCDMMVADFGVRLPLCLWLYTAYLVSFGSLGCAEVPASASASSASSSECQAS